MEGKEKIQTQKKDHETLLDNCMVGLNLLNFFGVINSN